MKIEYYEVIVINGEVIERTISWALAFDTANRFDGYIVKKIKEFDLND